MYLTICAVKMFVIVLNLKLPWIFDSTLGPILSSYYQIACISFFLTLNIFSIKISLLWWIEERVLPLGTQRGSPRILRITSSIKQRAAGWLFPCTHTHAKIWLRIIKKIYNLRAWRWEGFRITTGRLAPASNLMNPTYHIHSLSLWVWFLTIN
jgi:hypothetical protein